MVEIGLTVLALTSLATLAGIVFYLFREGLPVFSQVTPLKFIFGTDWYPVGDAPDFEIGSLIAGSLAVTALLRYRWAWRPQRIFLKWRRIKPAESSNPLLNFWRRFLRL